MYIITAKHFLMGTMVFCSDSLFRATGNAPRKFHDAECAQIVADELSTDATKAIVVPAEHISIR